MNKFNHFLGIDVSKDFFDAVIIIDGDTATSKHNQFTNNYKGVVALRKWLKQYGSNSTNTLACLEHTGMYGKLIIKYLLAFKFSVWVEMSLRIIKSIGIQRGKNDKIDAYRIAYYAFKNVEIATLYKAPRIVVEKIRALLSLRDKLLSTKVKLTRYEKELRTFDPVLSKLCKRSQKQTLKSIEKDMLKIDKQLENLIKEDDCLAKLYQQTTSVVGVGRVTALYLIVFTNEFTMYTNPRQLACYAGVVPFEYTSGKSVRSKPKVHYMANKKLKKHLHLCAMSAIMHDPEIKQYYHKKVEEGKSKMLVINNVRNKLVHRICSCIKNNKLYEVKLVA
jgi:transposase